jgi:hypothetical protein
MRQIKTTIAAIAFLFVASPLAAQTVTNPAFAQNALATGSWNAGPVPGWAIAGSAGLWTPPASEYPLVSSATVAWSNGGAITQDLGTLTAGNYNFSVQVGARGDGYGQAATYTVSLGACSQVGTIAAIPVGTFLTVTQPCNLPAGDAVVSLACSGPQCDFTNVLVQAGPPPPFVWVMPGLGTATFPMYVPPACGPNDGTCSIVIQVCDTSQTPPLCMTAPVGTLSLIKTISLPTPQVQTIPVVVVTNP